MRVAKLVAVFLAALCADLVAQGALALAVGHGPVVNVEDAVLVSADAPLRGAERSVVLARVEAWAPTPELLVPQGGSISVSAPSSQTSASFQRRVGGGGRVGTLLGWIVGVVAGPAVFGGRDLGCDDIECYGRIRSGEAFVSGAVVMGGIGFLSGSALGASGALGWLEKVPLDVVRVRISPRGKPGLKLKASINF
jgi:hypothetical protein